MLALRDWPEAAEHLRVCYRPGSWSRNCGACMKCRTAVLFAHAVFRRAIPCLGRAATLDEARGMVASGDPVCDLRVAQFVRHARALGLDDEVVRAAEAVARSRGPAGG
jgi:hypothetical protein